MVRESALAPTHFDLPIRIAFILGSALGLLVVATLVDVACSFVVVKQWIGIPFLLLGMQRFVVNAEVGAAAWCGALVWGAAGIALATLAWCEHLRENRNVREWRMLAAVAFLVSLNEIVDLLAIVSSTLRLAEYPSLHVVMVIAAAVLMFYLLTYFRRVDELTRFRLLCAAGAIALCAVFASAAWLLKKVGRNAAHGELLLVLYPFELCALFACKLMQASLRHLAGVILLVSTLDYLFSITSIRVQNQLTAETLNRYAVESRPTVQHPSKKDVVNGLPLPPGSRHRRW